MQAECIYSALQAKFGMNTAKQVRFYLLVQHQRNITTSVQEASLLIQYIHNLKYPIGTCYQPSQL